VYVDESGIHQSYQREYGYARRGKEVYGKKNGKKGQRLNVIGGLCNGKHIAVQQYGHTTNASFFERWFIECLLKEAPRGCTIIIDNARFHRKEALLALIRKSRRKITLLFLPAYSPELNPIEKSWANLKRHLKHYLHTFPTLQFAVNAFFLT
jgi:transposase